MTLTYSLVGHSVLFLSVLFQNCIPNFLFYPFPRALAEKLRILAMINNEMQMKRTSKYIYFQSCTVEYYDIIRGLHLFIHYMASSPLSIFSSAYIYRPFIFPLFLILRRDSLLISYPVSSTYSRSGAPLFRWQIRIRNVAGKLKNVFEGKVKSRKGYVTISRSYQQNKFCTTHIIRAAVVLMKSLFQRV